MSNERGQLLTRTNAENIVVSRTVYDGKGRAISQEDSNASNQALRFDYQISDSGLITTTVTNRLNQKRIYVHDKAHNLLSFQDELGHKKPCLPTTPKIGARVLPMPRARAVISLTINAVNSKL
jgi:YD repeat-containing protein